MRRCFELLIVAITLACTVTAVLVVLTEATASAQLLKQTAPQIMSNRLTPQEEQILSRLQVANRVIKLDAHPNRQATDMLVLLRQQSQTSAALLPPRGAVQGIGPARTMGFSVPTANSTMPNVALQKACPTPSIINVDGKPAAITFSPTQPYNSYVIQGCFTGEVPKSVYLQVPQTFYPPSWQAGSKRVLTTAPMPLKLGSPTCNLLAPDKLSLVVDFPGPNPSHHTTPANPQREIDVHVPPCISGVLDQNNNVTLVVEYANGQKAQLGGFSFFAARQTVMLDVVPQRDVALYGAPIIVPPPDTGFRLRLASPVPNYSGAVIRYERGPVPFKPGTDTFDLHMLVALGFAVLEPEIVPFVLTPQLCQAELPGTGNLQVQQQGSWGIQWGMDPMTFSVRYQVSMCEPASLPLMQRAQGPLMSNATYAIRIPVEGPRGVDPWGGTGQLTALH